METRLRTAEAGSVSPGVALRRWTKPLTGRWTRLYARALALVLFYGALVHVGNMLGARGPWSAFAPHLRAMDLLLLVFSAVVGVGLWIGKGWAAAAFVAGIVALQVIPYTLFREYFVMGPGDAAALTSLIVTESFLVGVLIVLLALEK